MIDKKRFDDQFEYEEAKVSDKKQEMMNPEFDYEAKLETSAQPPVLHEQGLESSVKYESAEN